MKFTPGPWTVALGPYDADNDGSRRIMRGTLDDPAAYVRVGSAHPVAPRTRKTPYNAPDDERDANARLIAAAPDLYEALTRYMGGHPCDAHDECPTKNLARVVLAKVDEGRQG